MTLSEQTLCSLIALVYASHSLHTPLYCDTADRYLDARNQGRISGITTWGFTTYQNKLEVCNIRWESDQQTYFNAVSWGVPSTSQLCEPFSLASDDYIDGYRVYCGTINKVVGIVLYSFKGGNYSCVASTNVDQGRIDYPGYQLVGFQWYYGLIIDGVSFQFEQTPSPTTAPSTNPTQNPSINPTQNPSINPTQNPTQPSINPTHTPSVTPTQIPSINPSQTPTKNPSITPTLHPTHNPSKTPIASPTFNPTIEVTGDVTGNVHNTTQSQDLEDNEKQNYENVSLWQEYLVFTGGIICIFCIVMVLFLFWRIRRKMRASFEQNVVVIKIQSPLDQINTTELCTVDTNNNYCVKIENDKNTLQVWLRDINMEQYYDLFCKQGFDSKISMLYELTDDSLKELGVEKMPHRFAILQKIGKSNTTNVANIYSEAESISDHAQAGDEEDSEEMYENKNDDPQMTTTGGYM